MLIPVPEPVIWLGGERPAGRWPDYTLGIYLIHRDERTVNDGEAYAFVIAAIDEETARVMIHDGNHHGSEGHAPWFDPSQSRAVLLGRTFPRDEPRIILRHYQATPDAALIHERDEARTKWATERIERLRYAGEARSDLNRGRVLVDDILAEFGASKGDGYRARVGQVKFGQWRERATAIFRRVNADAAPAEAGELGQ